MPPGRIRARGSMPFMTASSSTCDVRGCGQPAVETLGPGIASGPYLLSMCADCNVRRLAGESFGLQQDVDEHARVVSCLVFHGRP